MIGVPSGTRVYLAVGATDMRKAINGLAALVETQMEQSALSGHLFVFCNRARTIVKALYWDHNGFCLWQKRLEADRFRWPGSEEEVLEIEPRQLLWLLSGLEVEQEGSHRRLSFGSAAQKKRQNQRKTGHGGALCGIGRVDENDIARHSERHLYVA